MNETTRIPKYQLQSCIVGDDISANGFEFKIIGEDEDHYILEVMDSNNVNKLDKASDMLAESEDVEYYWWNYSKGVHGESIVAILDSERTSTGVINDIIIDCDLVIDRVDKGENNALIIELITRELDIKIRDSFFD